MLATSAVMILAALPAHVGAQEINPICPTFFIDTSYPSSNEEDNSDIFVWIPAILVPTVQLPLAVCTEQENICNVGKGSIVGSTSRSTAQPAACTASVTDGTRPVYARMDYHYEESSGKQDRWTFSLFVECPAPVPDKGPTPSTVFNDRIFHKDSGTGALSWSWVSSDFPLGTTQCSTTLTSKLERGSWGTPGFGVVSQHPDFGSMRVAKAV